MLKIGEFSKLSHFTVKALRFYEKEGILKPASIDKWTGYRFYEISQLTVAAKIKALRDLDLSIKEIKRICSGADEKEILLSKEKSLRESKLHIEALLSSIHHILEEQEMKYNVTEKVIPKTVVYYSEAVLKNYSDIMEWIPSLGAECLKLNPGMKCTEPHYEFCEYLDDGYREKNIRIRHNEAVEFIGKENATIKFRELPEATVLSVLHKGPYENIGEAYAFIYNYAKENGYECAGFARECYLDGIWNCDNPAEWLTEIQLPIVQRND